MSENTTHHLLAFWSRVMEKLDKVEWRAELETLVETCNFFEFGACFLYEIDHTETLCRTQDYVVYTDHQHTPEHIDLEILTKEDRNELAGIQTIISHSNQWATPLEEKLAKIFNAGAMILVPVISMDMDVIALVGLVDRRCENRLEDLDIAYSISILRSIAGNVKLRMYKSRVNRTHKSLVSIMDNMGVELYVSDFYTNEILYMNRLMAENYGGVNHVLGEPCYKVLFGKSEICDFCPCGRLIDENGGPTMVCEWEQQRPDGSWYRTLSSSFHWIDGRLAHVASSIDITESKHNEAIIRQMADYDALTGLPNRRKLMRDIDQKLFDLRDRSREGYVLFFDLDGFKEVNDTHGHHVGDDLLRQIASFLDEDPLTKGMSYRHGGDEFVLLCMEDSPARLIQLASRILERFSQPWMLMDDGKAACRASIGITHFPVDGRTTDELLRRADKAMYAAKQVKGTALFYNRGVPCSVEEYFNQYLR